MIPEAAKSPPKARLKIWVLIGLGLGLLIGANAHLVYVAFASRPDCVAHVKSPVQVQDAAAPVYRAARPAC